VVGKRPPWPFGLIDLHDSLLGEKKELVEFTYSLLCLFLQVECFAVLATVGTQGLELGEIFSLCGLNLFGYITGEFG
jgi:hypothetical protein